MKCFKPTDILRCNYCDESQEYPAIDFIPRIPNLIGGRDSKPLPYITSVQREQCGDCDEFFFLKLVGDMVYTSNLPGKLYDLQDKLISQKPLTAQH